MLHGFYDLASTWENNSYLHHYDKHPATTRAVRYYSRYLLQKAMSVYEWTIPENWEMNYLLYALYVNGYVCITDIENYGVIPQICTISGFNIYYNPARAVISNPYMKRSYDIELGVDGELLNLSPDFCGIMDCVNEYAEMLANASCAVNTNLYNSRLAYLFWAKNKGQAQSFKKMYDEIGSGTPAVFIDNGLAMEDAAGNRVQPFEPFNANLKNTYITSDVLEDMRRIEHMFAQKIGLPNTNSEKRERMTEDETNKTDVESVSNVAVWYDTIQRCITRINDMFNIGLACTWRYPVNFDDGSENNETYDEME